MARPRRRGLTTQEHFELLVVELGLLVGHQGTLGAPPDGVHEAHAPQRHLLAAALVAKVFASHLSDKGLESRIYKEHLKFNKKEN